MSNGYQKTIVVGNLGQDPQSTTLESGMEVVSFSLAVNDGGKDADATWYNCKAWDKLAATLKQYATKGTMIIAEMRYTPRQYTPEGSSKKVTYPEFTIDRFRFLGGGKENGGGQTHSTAAPAQTQAQTQGSQATPATVASGDDDELPF